MVQNCLIIGAGHVGEDYQLPVFNSHQDVDIIALCDIDYDKAKLVAERYNVDAYSDPSTAFQNHEIDIVSICTPPQEHFKQIKEIIDRECAILVTKPTVSNGEELEKLNSIIEESNARITTTHPWKFDPQIEKVGQKIEKNEIGNLKHIHINQFIAGSGDRIIDSSNHWAHDLTASRWTETLPHPIYTLLQFYDRLQVSKVDILSKDNNFSGIDVDEFSVMLTSPYGSASLRFSANAKSTISDLYFFGDNNTIVVDRSNSSVRIEQESYGKELLSIHSRRMYKLLNKLTHHIKYHLGETDSSGPSKGYKKNIQEFINFSMGECRNPVPWKESYHTVQIVDKISKELSQGTNDE